MTPERIWTAEELEALTPDERHRVVNESIVTDPARVPAESLAKFRTEGRKRLETRTVINKP